MLGICLVIIGAGFVADGVWPAPVRWLRVAAGVMFAIAGILSCGCARPAVPPAA